MYLNLIIALLTITFVSPIIIILYLLFKATSRESFIFKQKRVGKNRQQFTIYKIRTMKRGAEKEAHEYPALFKNGNPLFKVHYDKRYTALGKLLCFTALDELPQLVNVIKGEMAFIGPRPYSIKKSNAISPQFEARYTILPGIIPPWIHKGGHCLSEDQKLKCDIAYAQKHSLWDTLYIFAYGVFYFLKQIVSTPLIFLSKPKM